MTYGYIPDVYKRQGYAGGIVSAAVDGVRQAENIIKERINK